MNIKPIKNEIDYQEALQKLELIFDAEPDTTEGDEATLLEMVIIDYEKKHFPIGEPDPVEAIKFRMEQMNLKKKDIAAILGDKSSTRF